MRTPSEPHFPRDKRSEFWLKLLLRYIGSVSLLALFAVFMPFSWMEFVHLLLDMGTLPREPVTSYLARSLSLFYAFLGAVLWFLSFRPRYYRSFLRFFSLLFVLFGATLIWIDFHEDMPWFWRYVEGPVVIFFGTLIFLLSSRLENQAPDGAAPVQAARK